MIKVIGFWIGVDILGFSNICYHVLEYEEKSFKKYMVYTNNYLKKKYLNLIKARQKIHLIGFCYNMD